ncbi:MAG: hypothetical protein IRZ00_16165 [Gemmatimonadetes bacterium]|nr:hypothetical protein [Gemmatimonadota bacterium]
MLRIRALSAPTALACILLGSGLAAAQQGSGNGVPSPQDVLGYGIGERFTDPADVVRYMDTLAAHSPRVRVRRYGETVEGRPLIQVVIAREDHLTRLDEILARNRELATPSTTEARAREIARDNPLVIYFQYGVHGNEASSSEAAMWTAWDLVRGAPSVAGVLDSAIVVIDPVVNPDGRNRYLSWYKQAMGAPPNPNPEAREHWEPWPGGRFNHYLFDLNRDWAAMTQPETRQRIATWGQWMPQVDVDFHEMSPNSSYFFFPATDPINPIYPEHILAWSKRFGEANAAAFDAQGWPYFTRESYDFFAPIYGDSWPSLLGAIGMTYEQAGGGRAGLAFRRADGLILTLKDRALHHWTTGEATARTAAANRTAMLLDFARFHRTQGEGHPDILLVPGPDTMRAHALVALLRDEGIEVERTDRPFRADARVHAGFRPRRDFPAGTYLVRARQPRGRLAVTLLQPETLLKATFSYDISAWSLPYVYGVEAHSVERAPAANWRPLPAADSTAGRVVAKAAPTTDGGDGQGSVAAEPYGYLAPPGMGSWPRIVAYLQAGGRVVALEKPFMAGGKSWPAGTFFLPRHGTEDMSRKLRESGVLEVATPIASGRVDDGNDLGTADAAPLKIPRVALLAGDGTAATSYGAQWFFLERILRLPFDALDIQRIGAVDLDDYDVVVVPELSDDALDESTLGRLKAWVQRGGRLIAVGSGAGAVAEPLAGVKARGASGRRTSQADSARALSGREQRDLERWENEVPGTILATHLDPAHPLAFGAAAAGDSTLFILKSGTLAFTPDAAFETAAYFPEHLKKVSGVISEQNLELLSGAAWLVDKRVGRGRVVLFADDPIFRASFYGMFAPFVNAIMLGPAL